MIIIGALFLLTLTQSWFLEAGETALAFEDRNKQPTFGCQLVHPFQRDFFPMNEYSRLAHILIHEVVLLGKAERKGIQMAVERFDSHEGYLVVLEEDAQIVRLLAPTS